MRRHCSCAKYLVVGTAILFLLYQATLFFLKGTQLQRNVDPHALSGYSHCAIDNSKLINYSRKYPCDFTPRPNPDVLIVTFVNLAWIPLARNWICSAEKVGLKKSLYLIAFEDGVCSELPADVTCYQDPNANFKHTVFGRTTYQKLVIERTRVILRLLSCSTTIAFVDADITFLKNPMAYLEAFTKQRDIVFQADSIRVKFVDAVLPYFFSYICGGFIYLHSNHATKQLWLSVLQYQENFNWNDQAGLNICVRHYTQAVRWATLDSAHFPNGQQFFAYDMKNPSTNMIVHANHLQGEAKIVRMISSDVWCYAPVAAETCGHQSTCSSRTSEWCDDFRRVCRDKYNRTVT